MINDDLHERLQKANDACYSIIKDLPPQVNLAELPEYQELQRVLFEHENKCDCLWN